MTTLAVLTTDGRRECIEATIASAEANLRGRFDDRVIFTDSEPDYMEWLLASFAGWRVEPTGERAGYAEAMRQAYKWLRAAAQGHVLWLEDDFTFNRPVDVDAMALVLDNNPLVAQLALRRQPWNQDEAAAGGIIEQHPDWYFDDWWSDGERLHPVLAHTGHFTNNPSLVARWVFGVEYPTGTDAEGRFSFALKEANSSVEFAYWGARDSGEAVCHVGDVSVRGPF